MSNHYCSSCCYITSKRSNFNKHLQSKKHKHNETLMQQNKTLIQHNETQNVPQIEPKMEKIFMCKFCSKTFTTSQSKYRHQSKYCKQNEKGNFEKLAALLNEKEAAIDKQKEELIEKDKQIQKLMQQLQIKNINLGGCQINGNNNTVNLQLLNYNKTDYDFLQDKDFIRCIQDNNHCVKALIEKIHFNKDKPENMNIYVSCMKGKFVMVYRDNQWQIRDRQKQIDDLYDTNEHLLENWFDEYSEKYPHIIKSFTRYLKNKEDDNDLICNVKHEILMMLYNKRNMIEQV
jgi:hypothetical protein